MSGRALCFSCFSHVVSSLFRSQLLQSPLAFFPFLDLLFPLRRWVAHHILSQWSVKLLFPNIMIGGSGLEVPYGRKQVNGHMQCWSPLDPCHTVRPGSRACIKCTAILPYNLIGNQQYSSDSYHCTKYMRIVDRDLQYLIVTFSTLQGPSVPYRDIPYLTGTFSTLQGPSVPCRDLQYLTGP
jgi:hypothetical protein